jgi:hypothetical protein
MLTDKVLSRPNHRDPDNPVVKTKLVGVRVHLLRRGQSNPGLEAFHLVCLLN